MDCTEVRNHLLGRRRGTLTREVREGVDSHLAECEGCRGEDAADRELSVALQNRLPRRRAPETLRRSIEERLAGEEVSLVGEPRRSSGSIRRRPRVLALIAAATLAAAAAFLVLKPTQPDAMVTEAVNDHLRILYGAHALEVESGGVHQVKPWFEGRVDFAPAVGFGGDDDFPLQGGAIAYFVDRKAAAYIYKRHLHVVTLFVYRADGLPWSSVPTTSSVSLGHVRAKELTTRGFHVLLWRDGDLGYALVSDLDPRELETLGSKIAGG
jgi:anti-sigma factor RsiW